TAVANLAEEGLTEGVHQAGDVMYDACRLFAPVAAARPGPATLGLDPGAYLLLTVHRAAATDTHEALEALIAVIEAVDQPMVFPVHPRTPPPPAGPARAWGRGSRPSRICACPRRSGTSTSPRCWSGRARCSPTRA